MKVKKFAVILIHILFGWALCGAVVAFGNKFYDTQTTLLIHAISVPLIFSIISYVYFANFNYTTPFQTAIIFLVIIALMDFFVVGLLLEKNLRMFRSLLGIWVPFTLIFLSTYFTGLIHARLIRSRRA
jgi:hypothetical protein